MRLPKVIMLMADGLNPDHVAPDLGLNCLLRPINLNTMNE